jgi:hypothetical protein
MGVQLYDSQTKRCRNIGCYASEEDAARAYDYAAVQEYGPGAKRNFPGEAISELPVALGKQRKEERKQRSSSRYIGVALAQGQVFLARAADGPTDEARAVHWEVCLRGGRSPGVRLCGCAGARTRCRAQLPGRGHKRAACHDGHREEHGVWDPQTSPAFDWPDSACLDWDAGSQQLRSVPLD